MSPKIHEEPVLFFLPSSREKTFGILQKTLENKQDLFKVGVFQMSLNQQTSYPNNLYHGSSLSLQLHQIAFKICALMERRRSARNYHYEETANVSLPQC